MPPTKTLYLMGTGEIKLVGDQYKGGDTPPWSTYLSQVENLVIGEGITGTGTLKIFSSLTKLKNVSFPSTFKNWIQVHLQPVAVWNALCFPKRSPP